MKNEQRGNLGMKLKYALGLFCAAGALLGSDVAQAVEPGKWYVRAGAGYVFPDNTTLSASGTTPGIRFNRVKLKGGFHGELALGRHLMGSINRTIVVRSELMFGYQYRKLSDGFVTENAAGGAQVAQRVGVESKVQSFIGMANLYFDLIEWYRFVPYVGFGAGISGNKVNGINFTNATVNNALQNFNISGRTETKLAWQLTAGTGYRFTQNLTGDLYWRYMNLGKIKTSNVTTPAGLGVGTLAGNLNSHSVMAGLRYAF